MPLISISMFSKSACTMMGSIALSSSCAASTAIVTVRSLPITLNAIWLTTSGMTGLTLPGMMVEPGCMGGRLISLKPVRGPDESKRRSLLILDSLTARRLTADEYMMNAPVSLVASIMLPAATIGMPVISHRYLIQVGV